jgi:hypothetical protein
MKSFKNEDFIMTMHLGFKKKVLHILENIWTKNIRDYDTMVDEVCLELNHEDWANQSNHWIWDFTNAFIEAKETKEMPKILKLR